MKKLSKEQKDELDKIIIQSDELKKKVRIRVAKKPTASKDEDIYGSGVSYTGSLKKPAEDDDFDYDVHGRFLKKDKNSDGHKSRSSKTASTGKDKKSSKDAGTSKYLNLGKINEKSDKKGPSEFRKKSANWRDGEEVVLNDDAAVTPAQSKPADFKTRIKTMSATQWVAVGMAAVIFLTAIMTTSVYAQYKGEVNRARAMAGLPTYSDGNDEDLSEIAEEVIEEVEPIAAEEPEPVVGDQLSLVLTSVEKDLKIKLVNQEDTLVRGVAWGVTVTDSDSNASTYDDEDTDGIIHITDMAAGDYAVTINSNDSLNGYTIPSTSSMVSVKAKIEYKVIANIKDEIKSEKEVNVAAEDANGNKKADVETGTAPKDTVEFVESTKTEGGEKYVAAEIDWSKVAKKTKTSSITDYLKKAVINFAGNRQTNSNLAAIGLGRLVADCEGDAHNMSNVEAAQPSGNNDGKHTKVRHCVNDDCSYSDTITENCKDDNADNYCDECGGLIKKAEEPKDPATPSEPQQDAAIGLDKTSVSVAVGKTVKVTPTTAGGSGDVTWSSSDSAVATVSGGTITGVKAGSCTVTATYSGRTATVSVTVTAAEAADATTKYTVTVTNGKADVTSCVAGTTVNLTANTPASGTDFTKWTGTGVTFANQYAPTTSFVMPAQNVSVSAVYTSEQPSSAEYVSNAQLYDSKNNALYKKSGDTYILASYQDYVDGIRSFFRKEAGYLYTGWQTIDGLTYYYKSDHTYVTGDQVIGGVLYHFATDGALTQGNGVLGIDVSKYQPSINWESVKGSGINYVIIRCGYRGASTGALIQDPCFTSHIKGAKAAGLKVGVYFFSTALTEMEAVEEASMCAALCSGYGINYPVFIDVEPSSRPGYNSLPAAQRTANIKAFCSTIQSAGYTPGVYANKTWLTSYINTSQLSGYKIWLAQYNAAGPTYSGRYDLWQYTSKGSVNGISGNVDMNQSYLGY